MGNRRTAIFTVTNTTLVTCSETRVNYVYNVDSFTLFFRVFPKLSSILPQIIIHRDSFFVRCGEVRRTTTIISAPTNITVRALEQCSIDSGIICYSTRCPSWYVRDETALFYPSIVRVAAAASCPMMSPKITAHALTGIEAIRARATTGTCGCACYLASRYTHEMARSDFTLGDTITASDPPTRDDS